jgi:PKD repeat protein
MNVLVALLSLAFLILSSLFADGSSRYFEVRPKSGTAPLVVTLDAEYLLESKNAEILYWDFGDGEKLTTSLTKINHTFKNAGTYSVKLQYLKNKQDKIKNLKDAGAVKIVVKPKTNLLPVPKLSCVSNQINHLVCDSSGSVDSDGSISSFKFDWGDGTTNIFNTSGLASHQYQSFGEKIVRLTVTDNTGSAAFIEGNYTLIVPPVADIQCIVNNLAIYCDGLGSYDPKGTALTYEFNFGNGNSEVNSSGVINYAYSNEGLFEVSLKITDELGLSDFATTKVQVVRAANILPTIGINCISNRPLRINCNATTSSDQDGYITSVKYEFDDGAAYSVDPNFNLEHLFSVGGNKTITVTVTDNNGGQSSNIYNFNINENLYPQATLTCTSPAPMRLDCKVEGFDPDGIITKFVWKFNGENFNSIDSHVVKDFTIAGFQQVQVTAIDDLGATVNIQQRYRVRQNNIPTASINCFVINGKNYQCNSNGFDPDGHALTYDWNVDGTKLTGENILYTFTDGGQKIISLKVTDSFGGVFLTSTTLNIQGPAIGLLCEIRESLKIHCDASNTEALNNLKITYYRFEFDQDDLIENKIIDYEFKTFGKHKVKLVVATERGEIVSKEQEFEFIPQYFNPKADFSFDTQMSFKTIFNGNPSLFQDRKVIKYTWNFGDESADVVTSSENVIHSFGGKGYYYVKLTVEDEKGAINSITKKIYISKLDVPDPGPVVDDTLLGIDSDLDGVRDDVQNWIANEAKENTNLKTAMNKLAGYYQQNFQNLNDPEKIRAISKKQEFAMICLSSLVDEERVDIIESGLKLLFFNTEERVKGLMPIMKAQTGAITESSLDSGTPGIYCQKLD